VGWAHYARAGDDNGARSRSQLCERFRFDAGRAALKKEIEVAKLIYSAIASLDGYVEDKHGGFASLAPDDEVHAFINVLERPIGTYLYGRRMYETMVYWESVPTRDQHGPARDYADIWRGADKIVYSRTLTEPMSERTRIERDFDPAAVNRLKDSLSSDISVGGALLGGQAMATGLVDECHLFHVPIVIGGGKPALPADVRVRLELLAERRFKSGIVHLHYGIVRHASW
jgi:dihydrofolate reductase